MQQINSLLTNVQNTVIDACYRGKKWVHRVNRIAHRHAFPTQLIGQGCLASYAIYHVQQGDVSVALIASAASIALKFALVKAADTAFISACDNCDLTTLLSMCQGGYIPKTVETRGACAQCLRKWLLFSPHQQRERLLTLIPYLPPELFLFEAAPEHRILHAAVHHCRDTALTMIYQLQPHHGLNRQFGMRPGLVHEAIKHWGPTRWWDPWDPYHPEEVSLQQPFRALIKRRLPSELLAKDQHGNTPLEHAVYEKQEWAVEVLLQNPYATHTALMPDDEGNCLLHRILAKSENYNRRGSTTTHFKGPTTLEIIKLLIDHLPRTPINLSPLMRQVCQRPEDQEFFALGPRNHEGLSCAQLAIQQGLTQVIEMLKQRGVPIISLSRRQGRMPTLQKIALRHLGASCNPPSQQKRILNDSLSVSFTLEAT